MGAFALRTGGGRPVAVPAKTQALLALLALREGRPLKRDVVGEWLWPDREEAQSRQSLRQALFVVRRDGFDGQPVIQSRGNMISLQPDAIVCDLHGLRGLLSPDSGASWQSITGLYTGPLLDGFPPVSPAFDDFLAGMRQALEGDVLGVLGRIADDAANIQDLEQYIIIAERMLGIDPLREDTHRRLIQGYIWAGRRTDAMRVFQDAKALLRREMDVAPSRETEALLARIRDEPAPAVTRSAERITVPAAVGFSGPPRIAVLPLRTSEEQKLGSHLTDGITADIITQLAGLRELTVISHGSTYGFRDPYADPREIGQKLNARYLVIGRIRRGGDKLRLTTELTVAESGDVIFSHTDEAAEALSFEDQDRIVGQLVNKLMPQVRETELRRIRGKRPNVLSVYEKVLLSREKILLLDRPALIEAKTLLDEVILEDPGYGEAYALSAEWHSTMAGEGWSPDRVGAIAAAERLAGTALSVDNCNLRALVSQGHQKSLYYRDHDAAQRMFRQALDVAPSSAHAWAMSTYCFAFAGEAEEAVRRAKRALELSPYDRDAGKFLNGLCVAHYTAGDYESAADCGLRALSEASSWRGTGAYTAASLAAAGRVREARDVVEETRRTGRDRRSVHAIVANHPYRDQSRRILYGAHLSAAGVPD